MGIRKIATTGDQLKQFYPRRNQENIKQYINRLESYKKYYDITVNKGKSYFNPWHQGRAYSLANFLPERDIDFELTLDKDPVRPVWANKKSTEFHLPGHNYIGPGTNLDDKSKYPVDLDDSIAKEHDEAYLEANSVDKVKQADKHAIHDFVSDFIDTGNPHSAIGSIGLGIKHLSGSNYGLNMDRGNKRKAEADSTSDDSNKKQTISNPAMVAKPEAVQQPTDTNQPGTGAGSTSNESGSIVSVDRPICYDNFQTWKFKKVHRMLSYGIAYANKDLFNKVAGMPVPTSTGNRVITTPLMEIPWDKIYLYLTPGELNSLPVGTQGLSARIKIVQRNTRVGFSTNASDSQFATFNQNKFGVSAVSLNTKVRGATYHVECGSNMIPTSVAIIDRVNGVISTIDDYQEHDLDLYGVSQQDASFNTRVPIHPFGLRSNPPIYFCCQSVNSANSEAESQIGWKNFAQYVEEWDMNLTVGEEVINMEHKFNYCPIKTNLRSADILDTFTQKNYLYGSEDVQQTLMQFTNFPPQNVTKSTVAVSQAGYTQDVYALGRYSLMEQGTLIKPMVGGRYKASCIQPSVHIGVKAIPALDSPDHAAPDMFANVQAYWEVTCELICGTRNPNKYTHINEFHCEPEEIPFISTGANSESIKNNLPIFYGRYNQ